MTVEWLNCITHHHVVAERLDSFDIEDSQHKYKTLNKRRLYSLPVPTHATLAKRSSLSVVKE